MGKKRKARGKVAPSDDTPALPKWACTDTGNAERLAYFFGKRFRYVKKWQLFIVWTGTHWAIDFDDVRMGQFTKLVVQECMPRELLYRPKTKSFMRWCHASQSGGHRAAMLKWVKHEPGIAISHEELDKHPMLFNCLNGTLDLKTGHLRKQRRKDLLTKISSITYDSEAEAPHWRKFLRDAMGGDDELVSYLQRHSGYCLTGLTTEHALLFHYGDGNNGKSTFLNTLHTMFGEYGARASRGLLFKAKNERHPTSLATLHGKRFVSCPEIEADQEFDEALVKDLSGGDPINARRMREDEWNFDPTHKLSLAGNYKPRIRGTDRGIWRRMHLVPWNVTVDEAKVDADLGAKLKAELAGILRWCVEGCVEWQQKKLSAPEAVLTATAEYKREQDVLGQFFEESLVFESEGRIGRKKLRELYEDWCKELGHQPVGARRLAEGLRKHKVSDCNVQEDGQTVNGWAGVRRKKAKDVAAAKWTKKAAKPKVL
jgi:putative DNA primase/helicase